MENITLEYENEVAIITNNRADKHNAFTDDMYTRLWEICDELHSNSSVRAVIWRANGKSWSAGRDTTELGIRTEDIDDLSYMERAHLGVRKLLALPQPSIYSLKGWVIGGSFEQSLLCDMRIAAEGTKFMLPEIQHGVLTDSGGMTRLFQMCGHGVTMDLLLTGRVLEADEALHLGIVSRVVSAEELDSTVRDIAVLAPQ